MLNVLAEHGIWVTTLGTGFITALLRKDVESYEQLELTQEHFNDDQLIDYVLQYPILINRQIVVTPPGTRLCRPSEVMHPGKKSRTVIP